MRVVVLGILWVCVGVWGYGQRGIILVGTYTDSLPILMFDEGMEEVKRVGEYVGLKNPSYLVVDKKGEKVFVVEENSEGRVAVLGLDKHGVGLRLIDRVSSGGADPCYVDLSPNGRYIAVANYTGGNWGLGEVLESGKIKGDKGLVVVEEQGKGVHVQQGGSHVHCSVFHEDNMSLSTANLGGDKLSTYRFFKDGGGRLKVRLAFETLMDKGFGPRHVVFNEGKKKGYVINELAGVVDVFDVLGNRFERVQQVVSDSVVAKTKGGADIHLSPDGRFLYVSNRVTQNSISIFKVDGAGLLGYVGRVATGLHPRNFLITPSGRFLIVANKDSDDILFFRRNIETGGLSLVKKMGVKNPVCLKWVSCVK